jgi:Cd2+/Zn2+-exporting ATPase
MVKDLNENKVHTCADIINNITAQESGILGSKFDYINDKLTLDYDPDKLRNSEVKKIAKEVSGKLNSDYQTCNLHLNGRPCDACAAALEKKALEIKGVKDADVNFASKSFIVTFDNKIIAPDALIDQFKNKGLHLAERKEAITQGETTLSKFLDSPKVELVFTIVTFIAMITALLLEKLNADKIVYNSFYLAAYIAGGTYGIRASIRSVKEHTINVDILMILAALGAAYINAPFEGAMLLFLFSLSNMLQAYAIGKTRKAIDSLMKLRPTEALVKILAESRMVPIEDIYVDDIIIIRPGERVPLDGVILEGHSSLDESSLTGESFPVTKKFGDKVFAGTINQTGGLEIKVTKLAKDSTIAKIIKLVEDAQSQKAKTQRFLDKAEQYYSAGVILFTLIMILIPYFLFQGNFDEVFYKAMTLMVVASPCALIISTPASILSAIGNGAKRGILYKGGAHLEMTADIKVIALDKTGTLTYGKPEVTDVKVIPLPVSEHVIWSGEENELLSIAAAVESKSEHPLAQAIVKSAQARKIEIPAVKNFQSVTGKGVIAELDKYSISVGSLNFFEDYKTHHLDTAYKIVEQHQNEGKTSVLVAVIKENNAFIIGIIAIADVIRPDAADVIKELRKVGVQRIIMLTGDNKRVAKAIAEKVGIDDFYAELMPEDKVKIINENKKFGIIAMVGDGVNDAPALSTADLGIAMGGGGTDVALETADVVLMSDDLSKIPYAIALSRKAKKVVYQNLIFSLTVIVLLIISVLGIQLPLPLGVVGHEGSTVLVCLNGLRLLNFKPASGK